MKTTKSLFPWFFGAPRPEKETTQPQSQTINPMEQQTQHRTNCKIQNPTQKQTPNQTAPTMKLRNKLDTMNFFQTLHNWLSGLLRSEKEIPQPQLQTQNPMEQHQTQRRTNRKPQNPTQKQTPNQTTRTMKLRNKLDAMNFFQTLHNWFSGLLRPEKETPQPQFQTINPMEQHQTQHRTNRKPQNPKSRLRLFSPLTNEAGSVKMPMFATSALATFLAIGGLILAATCDFDYSDSICYRSKPGYWKTIWCYYSGHTGKARLCCPGTPPNTGMCKRPFRVWIHETDGQRELRCTVGSKFDDCRNDTIPDRCEWKRSKYVCPASWQIGCISIKKMITKRGLLSYVITGNYCPPADSTAGDATGDDPSADPSDN